MPIYIIIGNVVSEMINTKALKLYNYKSNLLIIGPTQIRKTISGPYRYLSNHYNVISVYNMAVDIIGPFIMSFNHASNTNIVRPLRCIFFPQCYIYNSNICAR